MQAAVKMVRLADIDRDNEIYPRQNIQAARVSELAEYVSNGIKLDPIVVCEIRGRSGYTLVDGAHRTEVYLSKGIKQVEVEDMGLLTKLDAAKESITRNTHGPLPLSRSDRELAAQKLRKLGATDSEVHALTSLAMSIIKSLDTVTYRHEGEWKKIPSGLMVRVGGPGGKQTPIISDAEIQSHSEIISNMNRQMTPKSSMKFLNTLLTYQWIRKDDRELMRQAHKLYELLKPLFEGALVK